MLEVRLFGKFEIKLDGQSVDIPSRPAQSLLAYLILYADRPHRREKLAGLLWPDSDEASARNNLRQTLWRLRNVIGKDYFVTDRVSVSFNSKANYQLDADILQKEVVAITSTDQLIRIISGYEDRLLPGFYDEWVLLEQERLQALFEDRMQMLLDRLVEETRWREVRKWAEWWIARGQMPELAYRALMLAHAGLGDRAGVAATYQRCVEGLDQELGVEPSTETLELYRRLNKEDKSSSEGVELIRQIPTSDLPLQDALSPQPPAFLDEASEPMTVPEEVFIGRERELSRLDQFLAQTTAGRGQVALVIGEAGQGKTSLLNTFARRALEAQPALIVASGTCDVYTGIGDPYLPFREILSMLSGDIETRWAAGAITRDHARRLWRLLPYTAQALVDCGPDLIDTFVTAGALVNRAASYAPDGARWLDDLRELLDHRSARGGEQGPDQNRIFEEYSDVLAALAARQPLLIILDDLHWADLSSISLLGHLALRVAEIPIMFIGAYRPEEVAQARDGQRHPLTDILGELKRRFGDIWINLEYNEQTVGRTFVDALLDTEPNQLGETFRQQLLRHTGGHPLFTVELLRDMQARGDLLQDEQGQWVEGAALVWKALPARVEGVIEKRIGRLDGALQEVLTVASVEGEEFTVEVIARVLAGNERDLVQRLSGELEKQHRLVAAQGLWRLEPGGQRLSRYRFRHNLFRTYLYQSLDEVERSYWHEAVGNGLEQLYREQKEEIAVQLAQHFERAGLTSKAVDYWERAGDSAARVYANTEAIAAYRRVLRLVKLDETDADRIVNLYKRLGRAFELNSEFDRAMKTYEEMNVVAHQRSDRSMELASMMARLPLYAIPTPLHDPVQGQTLGEQALALARELNDEVAEANILWSLTNVYMYSNQVAQAIDYGEQSIALARKLNLREQTAFVLNDVASNLWSVCQFDRAKEFFGEAISLWRSLDNLPMLANSLSASCSAYVFAGDFDQAIAVSQEAFQICQDIDNLMGQSFSRMRVGLVFWERGQPGRAIAEMEKGIRLGELSGAMVPQITSRVDLSLVYGRLGAMERGLDIAQHALKLAETHIPFFRCYALGALTQLHLLMGDFTAAEAAVDQCNKDPNREAWPVFYQFFRLAVTELALKEGDHERALILTGQLVTDLRKFGMRMPMPTALYLQAQAFLGLGQNEPARDRWLEARAEAESLGSRRTQWQILYALSQLETDPIEAQSLHQQARKTIEYIVHHIDDLELRASFLDLPNVREIFELRDSEL